MVIPGHSESITGEIKQRGEKEFRISLAPLNFPVASHRVHRGTPPCASKSKGTFVMPSGWLRNYQPVEGDHGIFRYSLCKHHSRNTPERLAPQRLSPRGRWLGPGPGSV